MAARPTRKSSQEAYRPTALERFHDRLVQVHREIAIQQPEAISARRMRALRRSGCAHLLVIAILTLAARRPRDFMGLASRFLRDPSPVIRAGTLDALADAVILMDGPQPGTTALLDRGDCDPSPEVREISYRTRAVLKCIDLL